jgi:hypothetical protein
VNLRPSFLSPSLPPTDYTDFSAMSRGPRTTLFVAGFGIQTRAKDLAYEFERRVDRILRDSVHGR